ncbi:hypothetical protein ACGF3K_26905 [Streptomyces sp. NPDC047980]|uniref:hypothetical protein n=1 Tax=Streptomyces sp. NPDC047980 TaxID=3365494 RepID=UPI003722EDBC
MTHAVRRPGPDTRGHRLPFESVAAQYEAARPGCPPTPARRGRGLTGTPLAGSRVVDVGAGTAIATRLLRDLGARVVVEPGPAMAGVLNGVLPGVPLVDGSRTAPARSRSSAAG